MRLPRMAAAGVLGLCLLVAGCVKNAVEDGIARALTTQLGPADRYQVTVRRTTDDELTRGIVHELEVDAQRVARPDSPIVDEVTARILEMQADPATRSFKSARQADVAVTFREGDLLSFIHARASELNELQLYLLQKNALVIMSDFPLTHQPLRISGTVALDEKQRVNFVPKDAFLGTDLMDPQLLDVLMDQVNPLADLSKWPVKITMRDVEFQPGRVTVNGTITAVVSP